jgi:hypothetical protein
MNSTIATLREELLSTTANVPNLEAAVKAAQERLRFTADKIAQIQILLRMLEAEASIDNVHTVPRASAQFAGPEALEKKPTKSDRMETEVASLLSLRGPTHRKDIAAHLIDKEIMGHEKDPLAHLAAFLSSKKDLFESDGRGVFTLRRFNPPGKTADEHPSEGNINGTSADFTALVPESPPMLRGELEEHGSGLFDD